MAPPRPREGHKGTFGHVFVLAGSRGFTGAAKLASGGALRSGVGLVTVGVPEGLGDVMAVALTEAMSLVLPGTKAESFARAAAEPALAFAAGKQAVVLGPGISQHEETKGFVGAFLAGCEAPVVLDADGLNCLAGDLSGLGVDRGARVLTPHPGEMARLTGMSVGEVQRDREGAARELARAHGCVVVMKGAGTVVADAAGETWINETGNPGMASGGTGDVLAGLMGGLIASGLDGARAACVAVYVHGLAGDLAAEARSERGMTAVDLLETIPLAWKEIERGSGDA